MQVKLFSNSTVLFKAPSQYNAGSTTAWRAQFFVPQCIACQNAVAQCQVYLLQQCSWKTMGMDFVSPFTI